MVCYTGYVYLEFSFLDGLRLCRVDVSKRKIVDSKSNCEKIESSDFSTSDICDCLCRCVEVSLDRTMSETKV